MSTFPARAVVDLDAIAGNVAHLATLAPRSEVMAVVKADAYGHGLVPSALAAQAGGATWLGVAQLAEALTLRAQGVTGRILTWIYAPGAPLEGALAAGLDLSVGARWALEEVVAAARASDRTARVHLKVDTGLARGGMFLTEWTQVLAEAMVAQAEGLIEVVGVWSHLASAEDVTSPVTQAQLEVFTEAVARAEAAGARLEVRHLANSAATLVNPAMHFDLVRPGLAVFGLSPVPGRTPTDLGLTPAMRLEAEIMLVKDAPAGQGVSYGHTYTTTRDTVLADIPLGYADGIPRHASGVGPFQVGGRRLTIAGRVCMDQVVLDLGRGARERAGDVAVLFGPGGDGEPTAQDWADAVGTISYEIVTRLGSRVPRVYVGTAGRAAQELAEQERAW
ncbi:alanine racemase [Litorihabitans aurantiacus]|uniref:Alanine racemase n=1 Tax=Litorihabitans aurantiacus TaxID=1930061 RepID=A0AA37XFV8_9MICO|nr:alanine racemase [Litorihabitans aurantiacus]GMA32256.1 alanine racemase [Litorihabitans aurantiacus]